MVEIDIVRQRRGSPIFGRLAVNDATVNRLADANERLARRERAEMPDDLAGDPLRNRDGLARRHADIARGEVAGVERCFSQ